MEKTGNHKIQVIKDCSSGIYIIIFGSRYYDTSGTVSYTHLDVYKRQVGRSSILFSQSAVFMMTKKEIIT